MTKKTYVINCGKRCAELLERISEEVPGIFSASIDGEILRITFDDSHVGVRETIEAIKDIARTISPTARAAGNISKLSVRQIQRRIAGPLYVEPLVEAIKLRGYKAGASEGYIETNAPIEEVIDIAMAVARCAEEAPKEILTPQARKALIALCAYHDISVDHLIRILEDLGVLVREPSGRIGLTKPIEDLRDLAL
ncbi:MAG: DUF2067 family protein [Sulfolobales archaeon]